MRNELNVITIDEEPSLNFMRDTMYSEHEIDYIRETSLDVGEELIIGRNEEKMKIVASLLQRRLENIIILPIFGMGGIGKTTFAKFIYDDDNFRSCARVWVRVSHRFDLKAIREDIKSQLPENKETKSKGSGQVTQLLSGEKVLIVLDDLWEEDTFQLEDLRTMLTNIGKSVKIVLVTTRSESIADKMYATLRPYNIASLTDGMCWEIMKHKNLFEYRDEKEQLRGIGCDIAMKCGGIPLAAQSLGFMLKSMTFDEWTKVRDSDIWKESISKDANLPNHVLASLKLSYTNMGDRCLKECFTYCSIFIFHEDEPIFKDNLIHQWISLGFIKPTKMHSIMQLCEKYFAQLVGLSFLQLRQRLSSTKGYVTYFSMHDLVHDLAKIVMADPSKQGITGERSCRYVLLTDCSKPLEESTSFPDNIRALRYFNSYKNKLVGSAVSSARSLKVLDFINCSIGDELPGSIGELEQLRYLNATLNGNYERSNCFNKLSKLIYLILKECNMTALPESICEIGGLMHLDISGCSMIKELPKSFVKLKKLVHLDLSDCSTLRSGVSEALVGLTNMQHLNVSGLGLWNTYGFYQISPLYGLPELLRNLTELRYLGLGEVISSILWKWDDRIEYLPLNVTIIIDDICRTLPNLEHLDLSKNIFLVSLPESIEKLKKLHTLNLSLCLDLVRLPECIGNMGSLRILNVDGCKKLDLSMLSGSNIGFMVHGDGPFKKTFVL